MKTTPKRPSLAVCPTRADGTLLDWFADRGLLATVDLSDEEDQVFSRLTEHRRPNGLGARLAHGATAGWSTPVRPVALSTGLPRSPRGSRWITVFSEVQLCSPLKMPSSLKGPLPNRFRTPCSEDSRTVTKCLRTPAGRCGCLHPHPSWRRVQVELTPYDLQRGRITYRYK